MFKITLPELIAKNRCALKEKRLVAQSSGERENVYVFDEDRCVGCSIGVMFIEDGEVIRKVFKAGVNASALYRLKEMALVSFDNELTAGLAQATQHLHDKWSHNDVLIRDEMAHFLPFVPEAAAKFIDELAESYKTMDEPTFVAWLDLLEETYLPRQAA